MNSELFLKLKRKSMEFRNDSASQRMARLNLLDAWLKKNETEVIVALQKDFSKPIFETTISELIPVYSEIKYFKSQLKTWMKDQKVPTPLTLFGNSSFIRYENKGVVLIISPWNYPFYLSIVPLIAALAAGNTVVIKPSELTPHTSSVVETMIKSCFAGDIVSVELGDKSVTENLLNYQFDHVFFTGSTAVGRIIAKACSEKLIPVTLELGGKSPTIIDESADLDLAAQKIFWGKFLNRGQTCVAPDYIVVHESVYDTFVKKINLIQKRNSTHLEGQIINADHDRRLSQISQLPLQTFTKLAVQIKTDIDLNDPTMKDEIFGPVLPVLKYKNMADIEAVLTHYEKPLSLYIFSKRNDFIESILRKFQSGSVGINTVIVQLANPHLPFGGVGDSGMGRYHGWHGFVELSHQRAIIKQYGFQFLNRFILPPYTPIKLKMLNWLK